MRLSLKVILSIIFILIITIDGKPEVKKKVNLEECIKIALQNHPDMRMSLENVAQARASYRIAQSEKSIKVALRAQTIQEDTDSGDDPSLTIAGRDVEYKLRSGIGASYDLVKKANSADIDIKRKNLDLANFNEKFIKNKIIYNVKLAYLNYISSLRVLEMREEVKAKYQVRLNRTKILVENGERPVLDLSNAEVHFAKVALDSEKAKNNEQYNRSELLEAMGLLEDSGVEFAPVNISNLPKLKYDLDGLYRIADTHSLSILKANNIKETNRLNIHKAQAANWPTVKLDVIAGCDSPSITKNGSFNENQSWQAIIGLQITAELPIYTGGKISASVDFAVAKYNKSKFEERKEILQTRKKIKNLFYNIEVLKKQMNISRLTVANARTNVKLSQKSYDAGIGTHLAMQNSEIALSDAEMNLLNSRFDYLKNLAKLSNIIGLGEDYLCEK